MPLEPGRSRPSLLRRYGRRGTLIVAGLLLAAIPAVLLVVVVRSGWAPLHRLDFHTDESLNRYIAGRPGQVRLWKAVTTIGGPTVLRIGASIAVVVLWLRGHRRTAMLVVVAMAGAALLSAFTKVLVNRVRPVMIVPVDRAEGGSFPSGHAQTSIVAMGVLVLVLLPSLSRKWQPLLVTAAAVVVIAIGFSRLILGLHYLSDILGGWIIGAAWLCIAAGALHPAPPLNGKGSGKPSS